MTKNNTNLIVAIIFLLGFLAFWEKYVVPRYTPAPLVSSKAAETLTKTENNLLKEAKLETAKTALIPAKNTVPYITLENGSTKVTLEREGGKVSSWEIKEGEHWLQMMLPEKHRTTDPLTFFPEIEFNLRKISNTAAEFVANRHDGLVIRKTVSLSAQPPFHEIDITLQNPTVNDLKIDTKFGWGSGIDKHLSGEKYDEKQTSTVLAEQAAVAFDGVVKRWKPGFIFKRTIDLEQPGTFQWIGVSNNHFVATLISPDKSIAAVKVEANRKHPPLATIPFQATIKAGSEQKRHYFLYVGAKKYDQLKTFGYDLDKTVDFGFFGAISKFLLFMLKKFEAITGNYGWAIIILTFCIQILVFPLTIKNFKHSLRMKELQPQIKKIQDQFKSDPKRMQVETFNLYRKNGMKFMGMEGCFPVLLQIPVFFAFYSTLNVAYELRGAPWIFWITDLAQHDPIYVLPIIMGAGMFVQQKLTAVTMDPAQARMMMFMPIMFTFMFLKLPAGLVLYWCVNSITNIVITEVMKRRGPAPATT